MVLPCRPDGYSYLPISVCVWRKSDFLSNCDECSDVLPWRPDECNLKLFESSRHWWVSGRYCHVIRTDVANRWTSGCFTGSSGRKLGDSTSLNWNLYRIFFERFEMKTLENMASLWKQQHYMIVILSTEYSQSKHNRYVLLAYWRQRHSRDDSAIRFCSKYLTPDDRLVLPGSVEPDGPED